MQKLICATFAIGIVATFATANVALSQGTTVCRPGGNCIRTSAANYNHCVDVAMRRGLLLTKGDRYNLDRFVYDCVAGRTRR